MLPELFELVQRRTMETGGALTKASLKDIQDNWSDGTTMPIQWIVLAAGMLLVSFSVISLYRWWKSGQIWSSPLVIFYRLASDVGLDMSDQWLLWCIARREDLPSPLTLLMSPATLAHHARRYAEHVSPRRSRLVLDHAGAIGRKLFTDQAVDGASSSRQQRSAA